MSDDIKVTRLSKAAREFNVGISTIVEFLHKKGFSLDPNPNTKIPPEAYALLVKEYSTDISVKKESEKLMLKDLHKKKETVSIEDITLKPHAEEVEAENEIIIKDATGVAKVEKRPDIAKPEVKVVGKIDLEKTLRATVIKPEEKEEAEPAEKPEKKEKKKPAVEEKEKEAEIMQESTIIEEKPEEIEIEERTGLVTEFIKSEPAPEPLSEAAPETTAIEKKEEFIPISGPKLAGPVILGKIDLPAEEKKKSSAVKTEFGEEVRHKRKRKRISKEKEIVPLKPGITEKGERTKVPLKKRPVRAEVDEDEVQKQIKETLARLTAKGKLRGLSTEGKNVRL